MILITSTGEFLLYFTVSFSFVSFKKIYIFAAGFVFVVLCCPVFDARIHVPVD